MTLDRIGNYRIIREIGRGGMGTVYLATHVSQGYHVALKVLSPQLSRDAKAVRRFQREAQALLALDHAHIVKTYEVGSDHGLNYIAMQYIQGSSLAQLLSPQRPLDLRTTATVVQQIASALDYAHAKGFVHRDVKPSNILFRGDGRAVLTDFGLAKSLFHSQLTSTGATLGTPAYMSPEQARGVPLDRRTDIYSLGVVCYEMVTGRVPFQKEEAMATLFAHVREQPTPPRRLNPSLPQAVELVVLRALDKNPARRYNTAGQLAQALAAAARQGVPGIGRARTPGHVLGPGVLRNPALLGLVALGAIAIFAVLLNRNGPGPQLPAQTTPLPASARVAFESDRDGNRELYVADAAGSALHRLTTHAATDWAPAWSPDGQRIAFASERAGNMDIYVMDTSDWSLTCLTDHSAWDSGPAWSPDGRFVAFDSDRDGDSDIYVMQSDGSGISPLTHNPAMDGDPAWSPAGNQIAFVSERDGNYEIYVMDRSGTNPTRLTRNTWRDSSPAWSPDGRSIAFECQRESGSEICTMNADGSGVARLTFNTIEDRQPCWRPGGAEIAFSRQRASDGGWEIWVADSDGSNERLLIGGSGSNANPAWRR